MTLLDSLLDAIVRLEGDALVMHVGEKPYVVTTTSAMNAYRGPLAWGQVELSSRVLTPDAVLSMVGQILPADQCHALEELGAVEHEIASPHGVADRFSVVAARGGDDIWLELRRHPVADAQSAEKVGQVTVEGAAIDPAAAAAPAGAPPNTAVGLQEPPPDAPFSVEGAQADEFELRHPTADTAERLESDESTESVEQSGEDAIEERFALFDEDLHEEAEHVEHIYIPVPESEPHAGDARLEADASAALELIEPEPQHAPTEADVDAMLAATAAALLSANLEPQSPGANGSGGFFAVEGSYPADAFEVVLDDADLDLTSAIDEMPAAPWSSSPAPASSDPASADQDPDLPITPVEPQAASIEVVEPPIAAEALQPEEPAPPQTPVQETRDEQPSIHPEISVDNPAALPVKGSLASAHAAPKIAAGAHEAGHSAGVVVPIGRPSGRPERPDAGGRVDDAALLQMLRVAAERGASTVYVVAQSKPMIRVDGEISALDEGPALTATDIERLVSSLAPPRAPASGQANAEWISEVPQVGRVRCVTFHDHRGPGLIFRLISPRLISADHLNLPQEVRELCTLSDGLVLVAGARGSGKSTLLNSFLDLVNSTRSDHVVTVETEIAFVHESKRSFISQREVHDDGAAAAAAVNAALREDPDVLVIEDVQSPDVVMAALHAAESGRLVFASINAPSSASAVEALVNMVPEAGRASIRTMLAGVLRAVVAQLLLRKASGGRVAARELLLNSPAVSASIRDASASGIATALESGQRHGMMPLNDSLAALVRGGTVHGSEAYRRAPDRGALLASLARDGVDTAFAERLA